MSFPQTLPRLPCHAIPANVLVAFDRLCDIYRCALRVLNREDADPLQLTHYLGAVEFNAMPVLAAIPVGSELEAWVAEIAKLFGNVHNALSSYRDNVQNRSA